MNSYTRRLQGRRAKIAGASFEAMFYKNCLLSQIAITRIPDSCRRIAANKLIQVRSPFDWVCSYQGKAAVIDTKTTQGTTFAHSLIDHNQVKELSKHERHGILGGYVVWAREIDQVYFIPASALIQALEHPGSFDIDHIACLKLGGAATMNLTLLFK